MPILRCNKVIVTPLQNDPLGEEYSFKTCKGIVVSVVVTGEKTAKFICLDCEREAETGSSASTVQ